LHNGLLRVRGRLSDSSLPFESKHPVLLPRRHFITQLIIRDAHARLGHAGRGHVLSALRAKFWVIAGNAAVRAVITSCVRCRRFRRPVQEQKMANLPSCRIDASLPPFSYVAVDYFGPFLVKDGRKELKRYGVVSTCMVSRAVHLEVAKSLETNMFINAMRRFVARRGNIVELWSDNGTNFVGAHNELKRALQEMNQNSLEVWSANHGFQWHFNPPSASHMGGVWERVIRSVRNVFNGLFSERMPRVSDDEFHTLLCEVENVVNTRPLTTVSSDAHDLEPLTPAHLLMLKPKFTSTLPPPGVFTEPDLYSRRRWRRVQYLLSLFWSRWKKEYMSLLQSRMKWNVPQRDVQVGDVVLMKEETSRNCWPLALVQKVSVGRDNRVRVVWLKTAQSVNDLCRPVSKIVVLVENDAVHQSG
jgi:hypothetical protein